MTIFSREYKPSTTECFFFLEARLKVYCLTIIEDTDRNGKFKRILSFPLVEKEKLNFSKKN